MAGNLGGYQLIVEASKAVGGPRRLVILLLLAGAAMGKVGDKSVKQAEKWHKARRASASARPTDASESTPVNYTASRQVFLSDGLVLREHQTFRIIAQDGDTVFLNIEGRADNPHAVSLDDLTAASDVPSDFTF